MLNVKARDRESVNEKRQKKKKLRDAVAQQRHDLEDDTTLYTGLFSSPPCSFFFLPLLITHKLMQIRTL